MKQTITLSKVQGSWVATHSDPQVKALFGTDTIPTAFTDEADPILVYDRISKLNPEYVVLMVGFSA